MNFSCFFVLAAALVGVFAKAYEMGYHGICEGSYGGLGCGGTTVSDTCHCVKTVIRPVIEQIPYISSRRIHSPGYIGGTYRDTVPDTYRIRTGSGYHGYRSRYYGGGYPHYGRIGGGVI